MTQDSRQQGGDPLGDFQRWLMRSGARGVGREIGGNLRKTFGYADENDVWESATREPQGEEPPECEWCPLCRAARMLKDSGPDLGSHLSTAGGIVATVVQDAVDAFESLLAAAPAAKRQAGTGDSQEKPADGPDDRR